MVVNKRIRRTPRDYDGTAVTTHSIGEVLSTVMMDIGNSYHERPDLLLASWSDVIGPQLAPMTQAISFVDGVLVVKVKNSTLHSLLNQHDKPRIMQLLRQKFPRINIRNVVFRLG